MYLFKIYTKLHKAQQQPAMVFGQPPLHNHFIIYPFVAPVKTFSLD